MIDPSSIILEQWACLNGSTSLDPELQNRNKRAALGRTSSVYINESWNFGQTIWAKSEVLLGTSWGTLQELENHLRTREIYIYPSPPLSKRKKLDRSRVHAEPSHWLHEISLSKTVRHHIGKKGIAFSVFGRRCM